MNYAVARSLLLLVILALYLSNIAYACIGTNKYTVRIDNEIPRDSIRAHCKSKDDDLGMKSLASKQHFQWSFCQNIWQTTLYFCHFYWQSKQQVFNVFNQTMGYACFFGEIAECRWIVKPEGFYYYDFNSSSLIKKYNWQ